MILRQPLPADLATPLGSIWKLFIYARLRIIVLQRTLIAAQGSRRKKSIVVPSDKRLAGSKRCYSPVGFISRLNAGISMPVTGDNTGKTTCSGMGDIAERDTASDSGKGVFIINGAIRTARAA